MIDTLEQILALNGSVNLYMGHGGTCFGFWAGANGGGMIMSSLIDLLGSPNEFVGGTSYQPTITRCAITKRIDIFIVVRDKLKLRLRFADIGGWRARVR